MESAEFDETYTVQWDGRLEQTLEPLESDNVQQILAAKYIQDVRDYLTNLLPGGRCDEQHIKHATATVLPSLQHYEVFVNFFENQFPTLPRTLVLWGLLRLNLVLVSDSSQGLNLVASMIKEFGKKLELFNEYVTSGGKPKQIRETALDVHVELTVFFAAAIHFFELSDITGQSPDWTILNRRYGDTIENIDSMFRHIDALTRLSKRNAMGEQFLGQQSLLSLSSTTYQEEAKLPCRMLPPAKNARFYDRDSITERIGKFLQPDPDKSVFRALALYGVGGIGKSHVALKYAHLKLTGRTIDAVLWIHSKTDAALVQSFTDAALALGLPQTGREKHAENRIIVLNWLQQTDASWLLIFDNAEDEDLLLEYWPPACAKGSIIITTRNHNLQYGPADGGIEIPSFDNKHGSNLLLHLLRLDVLDAVNASETTSAEELSRQLGGHALALSIMAGLIQKRSWSIKEFLPVYEENKSNFHSSERRPSALAAIWKLSFESMDEQGSALLGIIAYFNPDVIPTEIFISAEPKSLPECLRDFMNALDFGDVVEPLLTLALIKRDKESKAFSIHRLVQTQYRYHLSQGDRQIAFNNAVKLLYHGFGRVSNQLYDRWARCQMYIQQIFSLRNQYQEERTDPGGVGPTVLLCGLLSRSSRYLVETANYAELEKHLTIARSAFNALPADTKERHRELLASILGSLGLLWGHRGFFERGASCIRDSNEIYEKLQEQSPSDKTWSSDRAWGDVDLGNLVASTGNYEEALSLELNGEKAMTALEQEGEEDESSLGIIWQNVARCYTFLGQFEKAHERLDQALGYYESSKNWAMLAFTLYVKGNLDRKQGRLEDARAAYMRAQTTWIEGGKLKTHHFRGACVYKLGCISDDEGKTEEAIKHLREALVIAKLKDETMMGDHARVLNKLATVLKKTQGAEVEAIEKSREALQILMGRRLSLGSDQSQTESWIATPVSTDAETVSADDTRDSDERLYDGLVYILWR